MVELETPTNALVEAYIEKFHHDERYFVADNAIVKLFDAFPANLELEDILLKISVINDLYSTNIFGTFIMSKHIQSLKIDAAIRAGNPKAVHRIATGHGIRSNRNNKELNFYSFATKYCNWHNREDYAIYDRFVHKLLMAYKRRDGFAKFKASQLKDFGSFKGIIEEFITFYGLSSHTLKEIDKFLWMYGKEKFPTKY